jgi:hypothetical protein
MNPLMQLFNWVTVFFCCILGIYVNLGAIVISINESVVMKTIDIRLVLIGLSFKITICSCEKKIPPTVETLPVINIMGTTAVSGGTIIDGGSEQVTEKGVCWSTNSNPTIENYKTDNGNGAGTFVSYLSGLNGGTGYYTRAYATNEAGTGYGTELYFTTLGKAPAASTQEVTNLRGESVTLNGIANANDLPALVSFEYGGTSNYGMAVTASPGSITGNSSTPVSADLKNLRGGTTYHYRIVATNDLGTTLGNEMSFVTKGAAPVAKTLAATKTTPITAQLNGSVLANDLTTVVTFEIGLTTRYGIIVAATQSPVSGTLSVEVSAEAIGLIKNTTFHYRIVATNSLGVTYGDDVTFTAKYKIGDNMYGGLIFYLDESGEHGLVCATSDQVDSPWGCADVVGAGGKSIGTGVQNTIDIVLSCPSEGYAAKACYDLELNGYDDWFLPSLDELNLMCSNLYEHNLGGFYGNYYWSSSQYDASSSYANNFLYNSTATRSKSDNARTRAVRAF